MEEGAVNGAGASAQQHAAAAAAAAVSKVMPLSEILRHGDESLDHRDVRVVGRSRKQRSCGLEEAAITHDDALARCQRRSSSNLID